MIGRDPEAGSAAARLWGCRNGEQGRALYVRWPPRRNAEWAKKGARLEVHSSGNPPILCLARILPFDETLIASSGHHLGGPCGTHYTGNPARPSGNVSGLLRWSTLCAFHRIDWDSGSDTSKIGRWEVLRSSASFSPLTILSTQTISPHLLAPSPCNLPCSIASWDDFDAALSSNWAAHSTNLGEGTEAHRAQSPPTTARRTLATVLVDNSSFSLVSDSCSMFLIPSPSLDDSAIESYTAVATYRDSEAPSAVKTTFSCSSSSFFISCLGVQRPGPTTTELGTKLTKDTKVHNESKWKMTNPDVDLSSAEKRLLLSRVVRTVVKVVFANHVYQFAGVLYIQLVGGPIGLKLTSLVARIVMDKWSKSFSIKLELAGWRVWARMKYVDDINLVVSIVKEDLEWVGGNLVSVSSSSPQEEKTNMVESLESPEAHSMRLIRELADSVFPWLKFTSNLPEDHESLMVPMMDLQVWVQHHPAGSGEPAARFSHQGPLERDNPLPAVAGDPAVVPSQPQEHGENPAGSGDPAGRFSHQGLLEVAARLPVVVGDPAVVLSQPQEHGENPAGSGDPSGRFSHQGLLEVAARLPAVVGDPAVVLSQQQEVGENPAGIGEPAGGFSHQGLLEVVARLPAVASDPAVVSSQGLKHEANPAGSGDPAGAFSHEGPPGVADALPAVAGDPAAVPSQGPTPAADTLAWVFFEKPSSSTRVLKASSAYTWRAKTVSMNMEVFRRLRNTTRQVTIATRVSIVNQFIVKLRASGYSKSTISGIILSGTKFYYRKLQQDLEGGPKLNRRADDQDVQRKRAKIGASERWFKRRRSGLREKERKIHQWRSSQGHNNIKDQRTFSTSNNTR